MMAASTDRPKLIPCNPDNIPQQLKLMRRWAPWAAPWDEERKKYDKVPRRAGRPEAGLSNQTAAGWVTFNEALAAARARPDIIAGVGLLMTDIPGVVGVDLDHCVTNGKIDAWALEIVNQLGSYTEISPSGTGLHIMLSATLEQDWTAKLGGDRTGPGIEVYGGGKRFLTITGATVEGLPTALRPPPKGVLEGLRAKYHKGAVKGELRALPIPAVGHLETPDLDDLSLSLRVRDYLENGPEDEQDRSNRLIEIGAALAREGLSPEMALAVMLENEHTLETALSKRNYDYDKAVEYLWTHHCRRGNAIVEDDRVRTLADFKEEIDAPPDAAKAEGESLYDLLGGPEEDDCGFVDLDASEGVVSRDLSPQGKKAKKARFQFEKAGQFMSRPAPKWLIKGFLPKAALAMVYGASGSGKTFFAMDAALCVARGVAWRGVPVTQGGVAYVVAEGQGGFRDRLQAYAHQMDVDLDALPLHILGDAPDLSRKAEVDELGAELVKLGPLSVIVMDTYARVMGNANENEAQDVNKIVRNCELLHGLTGALILLIHHTGKDTGSGARGSSALRAAVDAEIEVLRTRNYRAAKVTKMKDGQDEAEFKFKLNTVAIGLDEDDEELTSCVVEHMADAQPAEDGPKRSPGQARVLDQLATYQGEVDYDTFLADMRAITPFKASGGENPNWKKLTETPLKKMIESGEVIEIQGRLSLPKSDL